MKHGELSDVKVEDLKGYPGNAREHSQEQIEKLKNSIREFGFVSPVLIDENMNIIAGHGRVMAAKELGIEKVPAVSIEGLTDEQRRAYILIDNKLTELGGWDYRLLDMELSELKSKFNMNDFGFEEVNVSFDDFAPLFDREAEAPRDELKKKMRCPCCGREFEI